MRHGFNRVIFEVNAKVVADDTPLLASKQHWQIVPVLKDFNEWRKNFQNARISLIKRTALRQQIGLLSNQDWGCALLGGFLNLHPHWSIY